jgi:nitrogen regulatory protein P-II 1
MKLIVAYVQPHKLSDVSLALHSSCGLTAIDVRGRGRGKQASEEERSSEAAFDFEKHVKLEVCCPDSAVAQVVEAIRNAAHTGLRGDGLICVMPVEDAVRISTGSRGEDAC